MKYAFLLLGAIGIFTARYASADPNTGTIQICRYPGITDINDGKSITIPAGSTFVQEVAVKGHDSLAGTVIKTLRDATLGPKPKCAKTTAVIIDHPDYAPPLNGKSRLLAQFGEPTTTLQTRVVDGFK